MQIVEQVEKFVLTGALTKGDQMPSVRNLSATLMINPNTIQKAFTELDSRGIISSVPGRGCFITETALNIIKSQKEGELEQLTELLKDLRLAGVSKDAILKCVERSFSDD